MNILAIDFETADYGADSACAIGIAKITLGKLSETKNYLIRPPRKSFVFTRIHGISWNDVRNPQLAKRRGAS